MNECLCCHERLIKHLNHRRIYWFCPSCHQEMPPSNAIEVHQARNVKRQFVNPQVNCVQRRDRG